MLAGISRAAFYVYCHRLNRVINKCPSLSYKLPAAPQEIEGEPEGLKSMSFHDVLEGCVGAIDGILLRMIVGHVKNFPTSLLRVWIECFGSMRSSV